MADTAPDRFLTALAGISPAAWAVLALGLAVAALPLAAGALAAMAVALLAAVALLVAPGTGGRGVPRSALLPLGLLTALAAWLTVTSSLAVEPRISFFGYAGQHDGALLWLVLALLAWSAAAVAGPRDLRHATVAVALLGAFLSLGAALDALGLLGEVGRFSPEASGFLENSLTLGQVLVLALGCSLAWAFAARSNEARLVAWFATVVNVIGLALSESRSAWFAVVAAAAIAAVMHRAGANWRRWAALTLAAVALVSIAVRPALLHAGPEGRTPAWLASALSDRTVIWDSALTAASGDLLLGRGPDQFSAWATWSVPEPGAVEAIGAYDPHDLLLYLLVSGGVPALLLGVAALTAFLDALWARSAGRGGLAATAVTGGLLAWAVSLRLAWVSPLAAALAALLAGVALAAMSRDSERVRPAWGRVAAIAAAVAGVAVCAAFARPAAVELAWASEDHQRTGSAAVLEADFAAWPEPMYARTAIEKRLVAGSKADLDRARKTVKALGGQIEVHVDAALTAARLEQAYDLNFGIDTRRTFFAAIDRGRKSDPSSGMWDFIASLWAYRIDDAEELADRASAALKLPQPDGAEEWLRAQSAVASGSAEPTGAPKP